MLTQHAQGAVAGQVAMIGGAPIPFCRFFIALIAGLAVLKHNADVE